MIESRLVSQASEVRTTSEVSLSRQGALARLLAGMPRWPAAALLVAALAVAFAPAPSWNASPVERHIHIEAASFDYAPAEIAVNPGDVVTLELVSRDVVHGLYVDGYGLNVTAEPGQPGRLTFVADRPGAFRLRCSVVCGPLHPFMIAKLSVGPNWPLWRGLGLAGLAALAGGWLAANRRAVTVA